MSRYLLPVALLSIVSLTGTEAFAHPRVRHVAGNAAAQVQQNMGQGLNGFGYQGYGGNALGGVGVGYGGYPGYIPMVYPGVGYASLVVPGAPANIYTQSYFNSPAYGHWNGFGK